jgi:fused signal recognition particle receptor
MSEEKKGFFNRLKSGLTKTRDNIVAGIDAVFYGASEIDEDFYEELEEILIMGDIGVNATNDIIERMKEEVKKRHLRLPSECKELLVESIKEQMHVEETAYDFEKEQSVIFIIGVNGVGKTTSVGKLAGILKGQGRKVLIAAADTFRAAAGEQLAQWANRAGVDMIGGSEGADPASVIYDAVNAAKARNVDVLICDTAGRLHNKKNLMEELKKMNRIIDREFPNAHRENLIVLDGTTGQNALAQAREFGEVANLTGVILTKMDGTAKGGIAVAIQSELNVPVKYIGVGEQIDDLQKFNADEFVDALFDIKVDEVDSKEPTETEVLEEEVKEVYADEKGTEEEIEENNVDDEVETPLWEKDNYFNWGDEEEEPEEQPKKKKWGFWNK